MQSLEPVIKKEKELLYEQKVPEKIQNKSLFQKYQESKMITILQPIKKLPIVGKSLLWFKHKILKWDI